MKAKKYCFWGTLLLCMFMMTICVNAGDEDSVTQKETAIVKLFPIKAMKINKSELPLFPIVDGKGEGRLPEGEQIKVEQAADGAVFLVIRKILQEETDVYEWFASVLKNKGKVVQGYEIYFLNEAEERFPADGAKISITMPSSINELLVCSVTEGSTWLELEAAAVNGCAEFVTDGSRYYVLMQKKQASRKEDAGAADKNPAASSKNQSAVSSNAKTSDETKVSGWIFLLLFSCCIFGKSFKRMKGLGKNG